MALSSRFRAVRFAVVSLCFLIPSSLAFAQGPAMPAASLVEAPRAVRVTPFESGDRHKFWDNENRGLFVAVAALSTADFFATRANLQHGGRELDPLTRPLAGSTAGLAVNFAGETASMIAISYFFHRTGHHKLERISSLVNIGSSGAAVGYDVVHRSPLQR
jgi:hypothetical protein